MKQYDFINSPNRLISHIISENRAYLEKVFEGCSDVVFREMTVCINKRGYSTVLCIFIDGLVNKERANSSVFKPLLETTGLGIDSDFITLQDVKALIENSLYTSSVAIIDSMHTIKDEIISGRMVLLVEGFDKAVSVYLVDTIGREIDLSEAELSVFGPKMSFNETLSDNLGQLRKMIRSNDLKTMEFIIGSRTNTKLILAYINGLAEKVLVNEVIKRLNGVDIDGLQSPRTLDELMGDDAFSPIPQSRHTERPDVVAASVLEGRVVIFLDGSPMAMIVPTVFKDFLEAAEDSYSRFPHGAYIRLISYIFFFISLYSSAIYVAFTLLHPEMIPPALLKFIIQSRSEVPFSSLIEILLLEFAYELIREGGGRLPSQSNKAITIISTLIVGTLTARVGIVSNTTVIIVAISSIAAFTTPYYSFSITLRLFRFPLIIAASFWGMYGIIGLTFIFLIYLSSIRSFGIPVLSPFAPMSARDLKDSFIRLPLKFITNRPFYISTINRKRLDRNNKNNS